MTIRKGNAPKTIPHKLTVTGQGETNTLQLTYHNRKASELEEKIKGLREASLKIQEQITELSNSKAKGFEKKLEELRAKDEPFLPAMVTFLVAEWDTDYSLGLEGIKELEDDRPGILQAIFQGYHRARQFALEKN